MQASSSGPTRRIGLVGYGEVGRILAEDLRKAGCEVAMFDLKLGAAPGLPMRAHAGALGVRVAGSHASLAAGSDLVVCAVTASQTLAAAKACSPALRPGSHYLDLNSASPGTKAEASVLVEAGGARYVECAVMTSVPPRRIATPMLLGGPHAAALEPELAALGFQVKFCSGKIGVASATKMCRSVMIKGMEAMVIEALTAARAYGVEDAVLASLQETFPGVSWDEQASYFFRRVIEHGRRRSEEMFEAARTVRETGLEAWSAAATAQRQAWAADLGDAGVFGATSGPREGWRADADRILAILAPAAIAECNN